MSNLQSAAQAYRINQVNSASPLGLVVMAYDAALIGCGQRDLERTAKALSVLRNALDFSFSADIAMGMFRLYQYCAELARQGDYDQAARLLSEMRSAWLQAKEALENENLSAAVASKAAAQTTSMPGPHMAAYTQVGARGQTLMTVL